MMTKMQSKNINNLSTIYNNMAFSMGLEPPKKIKEDSCIHIGTRRDPAYDIISHGKVKQLFYDEQMIITPSGIATRLHSRGVPSIDIDSEFEPIIIPAQFRNYMARKLFQNMDVADLKKAFAETVQILHDKEWMRKLKNKIQEAGGIRFIDNNYSSNDYIVPEPRLFMAA